MRKILAIVLISLVVLPPQAFAQQDSGARAALNDAPVAVVASADVGPAGRSPNVSVRPGLLRDAIAREAARLSQSGAPAPTSPPGTARNWLTRHPVLAGTLIGTGAGMAIDVGTGFTIGYFTLGAAAGAFTGLMWSVANRPLVNAGPPSRPPDALSARPSSGAPDAVAVERAPQSPDPWETIATLQPGSVVQVTLVDGAGRIGRLIEVGADALVLEEIRVAPDQPLARETIPRARVSSGSPGKWEGKAGLETPRAQNTPQNTPQKKPLGRGQKIGIGVSVVLGTLFGLSALGYATSGG